MYEFDMDLKKQMDEHYKVAQPLQQQWWQQAEMDTKMAVGQQDYWNQLYTVNFRNQRMLQFNKVLRVLNMISGYQRKNRHVSICTPIENSDTETADQLSGIMMWAMTTDGTFEKISDSFWGSLISGMNMMNVYMDYRDDPESGDIKSIRVPYNAFIMDPHWKDPSLHDCGWIWQRKYLTGDQVLALYPKLKNVLATFKKGQIGQDGRFLYMPENRQMYNQDLYAYDEYWTREYRTIKKIINKATGEVIDYPKNMEDDRFELFQRYNPNIEVIKAKKATVKLHVLVNNHLVYEEMSPYGIDRYPYVPFLCYFTPEIQDYAYRYFGVVRNIRDSQIELNRRRNKMLDILDSQINSGLIVKEDSLVDPEDAFLSGQGRVLFMKQDANLQDIREIVPPQIPPSLFELQKILDDEIMNIAGATEELFGQSDDKSMSGFLQQLRVGSSLVSLQPVFDKLHLSQKILGELYLDLIQSNFEPGKVQRILNKQPTQQFKEKSFQKYDCVVEEGILTSTQKQMQFVQLLEMRQMGIEIPGRMILEASTLQNKKELVDAIGQQEEQAAKMQQMQMQMAMEKEAVLTRSLEAKTQNDFASAEERKTRAVSNIGLAKERASQAVHDRASAALDNAKALKEIEEMDENRLLKLAQFIIDLQLKQKELAGGEEEDSELEAAAVGSDVKQEETKTKVNKGMPNG